MTTDNFCFYFICKTDQTTQTGSPFSIPCSRPRVMFEESCSSLFVSWPFAQQNIFLWIPGDCNKYQKFYPFLSLLFFNWLNWKLFWTTFSPPRGMARQELLAMAALLQEWQGPMAALLQEWQGPGNTNWRRRLSTVDLPMRLCHPPVAVPSISCCVLNHHNLFYQIQNALAFNQDMCCHLALCLWLLPFH